MSFAHTACQHSLCSTGLSASAAASLVSGGDMFVDSFGENDLGQEWGPNQVQLWRSQKGFLFSICEVKNC